MEKHNVLIIGSGGRENALAWKISQSKICEKLFIAPGNAGTSLLGENVEISASDFNHPFENKANTVKYNTIWASCFSYLHTDPPF